VAQPEMQRGVSLGKLWRYAGGSVVATVCSQLTFLLLYGVLDVAAGVTSVVAWFAGAVPNYWLNRAWTWQRSGRPSLRGELLPYAAIILGTLLLAVVTTEAVDRLLRAADVESGTRVALVTVSFLGVYVVMFGVRFFLLDRLFTRAAGADR
jgi:putative flippase GtrA